MGYLRTGATKAQGLLGKKMRSETVRTRRNQLDEPLRMMMVYVWMKDLKAHEFTFRCLI